MIRGNAEQHNIVWKGVLISMTYSHVDWLTTKPPQKIMYLQEHVTPVLLPEIRETVAIV